MVLRWLWKGKQCYSKFRISHSYSLFCIVTSGCSSASCAVHLSCESLRRGEISLAVASGVNLVLMVLNPLSGDDKDAVVLSNDYHCKTFDECKKLKILFDIFLQLI